MVTGKDTESCNALVLKQLRSVGAPVWDDVIDDAYGCLGEDCRLIVDCRVELVAVCYLYIACNGRDSLCVCVCVCMCE